MAKFEFKVTVHYIAYGQNAPMQLWAANEL